MKWNPLRWLPALAIATALAATPARATTVFHVPLDEMTAQSDVVLHARVGDQQVTWDKEHRRVLTLTRIEIIESLKGELRKGQVITVYSVGGTLDGVTFKIPGVVPLLPGEEIVYFGMRHEDMLVSFGVGQGKYRVHWAGGTKLVGPQLGDLAFVKRSPDGHLEPAVRPAEFERPLDAFLIELRGLVARPRGGAR